MASNSHIFRKFRDKVLASFSKVETCNKEERVGLAVAVGSTGKVPAHGGERNKTGNVRKT